LVCRLKPPDDARTLPNLKVVAINQLLGPLNSFQIVLACDYLRRPRDVIAAIQFVDSILQHIALPISGGSTTELSATDAWLGAVVGDATYIGTIRRLVGQVADVRPNFPPPYPSFFIKVSTSTLIPDRN
jgi:hypothetical protein